MDPAAVIAVFAGVLVVVVFVAVGFSRWERKQRRTEVRLARIEEKLDRLLGAPAEDPEASEIRQLVLNGQKVEAIRRYRERTAAGLAEAKQAVERIAGER